MELTAARANSADAAGFRQQPLPRALHHKRCAEPAESATRGAISAPRATIPSFARWASWPTAYCGPTSTPRSTRTAGTADEGRGAALTRDPERGGVEQPGLDRAATGATIAHLRLVVGKGIDDVELQAVLGQEGQQRRHLGDVLLEQFRIGASERDLLEVAPRVFTIALGLIAVRQSVPR